MFLYPTFSSVYNLFTFYTDLVFHLGFRQFTAKQVHNALHYEPFYNAIRTLNKNISVYRNTDYTMGDFLAENKTIRPLQYSMLFDNTTIAGFCKTEVTRNNRIYLYSYLIDPQYRGKIISDNVSYNSLFMNCVCESFRQQNYSTLELKVHEENVKAYNGYIQNGFHTTSKQEKRYMMEKKLS